MSRRCNRLSSRAGRFPELVYRTACPPVRTTPPPAPQIIRNTVHQTVVHLHQTTHQHIRSLIAVGAGGRDRTTLVVRQTPAVPAEERAMDPSRPARTARRLLRILSMESARRTMLPFYREMFTAFLTQEREERRRKPAQSLLLAERLPGRCQTLNTLRRFYRQTSEQLDGFILRSLTRRRYIRYICQEEGSGFVHRHALREPGEEPRPMPAAKRLSPPPRFPTEQEPGYEPRGELQRPLPPTASGLRLSGSEFQFLVQGVADALHRQNRLASLRRGGV